MTPEQKRIAIAEACGWSTVPSIAVGGWNVKQGINTVTSFWCDPQKSPKPEFIASHYPDYLNDLNAMHEAEKMLTAEQQVQYFERLAGMIMEDAYEGIGYWQQSQLSSEQLTWRATALQRADAFVRTIGS